MPPRLLPLPYLKEEKDKAKILGLPPSFNRPLTQLIGIYRLGARRRYEKAQRKAEQQRIQGIRQKSSKRSLQEGVLYLTIVNMPTEAELGNARARMREEKEKGKSGKA